MIECYQETLGFASELKKTALFSSADFAHHKLLLFSSSSCSIDQKHPAAPRNGPNNHPSRLSTVQEFSSWLFHLSLVVGLITRRSIPLIKNSPRLIEAKNGFVFPGVFPKRITPLLEFVLVGLVIYLEFVPYQA